MTFETLITDLFLMLLESRLTRGKGQTVYPEAGVSVVVGCVANEPDG